MEVKSSLLKFHENIKFSHLIITILATTNPPLEVYLSRFKLFVIYNKFKPPIVGHQVDATDVLFFFNHVFMLK